MATFNPESIDYDTYKSGPVDFYNQALDLSTLTGGGINIENPGDITELRDYGIAGQDGGDNDTQDDAINNLNLTSMTTGESMFPGGTGISYNTDLETGHHQYEQYSDYLSTEKPPGMADRVDFISNILEPLSQGRFGDINFSAGTEGLADRVGKDAVEGVTKADAATMGRGALLATGSLPVALAGSVLFGGTTVKNAFGNDSFRPDGILGVVTDLSHAIQYDDRAHNRAVMRAHTTGPMAGEFMTAGDEETDAYGNPVASSRGLAGVDIGFSMQFGSGTGATGITRKAGTYTYTGNMRGLDNNTLRNMEAIQRGFVPRTFGGTFGFDYTGKDAVRFEDAGYSNDLGNGGRYTDQGYYMDGYGRISAYGSKSAFEALASTNGITEDEARKAINDAKAGKGTTGGNIAAIKAEKDRKAAAAQAAAEATRQQAERDRLQAEAAADKAASTTGYGTYGAGAGLSYGDDDGGGMDVGSVGQGGGLGGGYGGGMGDYGGIFNKGGKVQGYAMGTPPPGVQASQSGFVDRPPSQVSEAGKVADDRPMKAKEGTYVINAAAVEFAGEQDIRKMIMDAQKEAVRRGLSTGDFERHSDLVDIAVSRGEVTIAPHLVDIIGEDRLEKINKRGIRKTEQRIAENGQEPVGAARGGFLA